MLRAALLFLLACSMMAPASQTQGTSGAPCADPAGVYATDFGQMHLNASGATGYYEWDEGRLTGSYSASDSTLTGRWSEAPTYAGPSDAGDFAFVFEAGCASFAGHWKHDSDPAGSWSGSAWSGSRVSPPPATTPTPTPTPTPTSTPPGPSVEEIGDLFSEDNTTPMPPACDMSGDWSTTQGDFLLIQQGDDLRSRNASQQRLETSSFRGRNVTGYFVTSGGDRSNMTMTVSPDCETFTGTFDTENGKGWPWTGTRRHGGGFEMPGPSAPALLAAFAGAALLFARRRTA